MSRPYAFINGEMENYFWFREHMLTTAAARKKFDRLNPHIHNEVVLPGQLIIVGDSSTYLCTPEEEQLTGLAQDVRNSLIGNGYTSNKLLTQNYDLLQSIMSYGSIGIGSSTAAWKKHLDGVSATLKDIEAAHKQWKFGALSKNQFIAQRQVLFSRLQTPLQGVGRFGTQLKANSSIKKMLGISSKSYLHAGEIAGYARTLKTISRTANAAAKGTYAGIALDVGVGALEINEACSVDREGMCTKAIFVEGGKTSVGIASAWAGGYAGAAAGPVICIGLGIPTAGAVTITCAVIAGALAGWGGGKVGSMAGDVIGTFLYESVYGE